MHKIDFLVACIILIYFLCSSSLKLRERKVYLNIQPNVSSIGCLNLCEIYITKTCLISLLVNEKRAMVVLGIASGKQDSIVYNCP